MAVFMKEMLLLLVACLVTLDVGLCNVNLVILTIKMGEPIEEPTTTQETVTPTVTETTTDLPNLSSTPQWSLSWNKNITPDYFVYFHSEQKMSIREAKEGCVSMGGIAVIPENLEQANAIFKISNDTYGMTLIPTSLLYENQQAVYPDHYQYMGDISVKNQTTRDDVDVLYLTNQGGVNRLDPVSSNLRIESYCAVCQKF